LRLLTWPENIAEAMALARQSFPFARTELFSNPKLIRMAIAAGTLAVLCGAAAFVLLVLRDHGHRRLMVNDQARPAVRLNSGPAATASSVTSIPPKDTPTTSTGTLSTGTIPAGKKEFRASKGSGPVPVGLLKLSVTGTDAAQHTYDLRVQAGRRAFSHRHIQIDQPLWISAGRAKNAIQLVVTRIEGDAIAGYWSEVARSARVNSSSKPKHR
jgi:hypothetical protein